ncbi:MAG: dTDP-4-dehydrorhamnose 3,5-epimerase [Phycisphaerales bacterium]|nr:dTDP-4-dehydrorhamnose 3,5-epimerase [Phycisphaerales bacterium]
MQKIETPLPGCFLLEPLVHGDDRGFFIESWNRRTYRELGIDFDYVQDNHSRSTQGVLRGIHYQIDNPQGKLVRVTSGSVFDVAVDLRRGSPTFSRWFGVELSEANKRIFWVPPGFGHGFYVTSETADFQYKCTEYFTPENDRGIRWNDPSIGIEWPLVDGGDPSLSGKDSAAPLLEDAEVFE